MAERRSVPGRSGTAAILVWQILVGVALLSAWQGLVSLNILDPFFVSRPTAIAQRVATWMIGTRSLAGSKASRVRCASTAFVLKPPMNSV